MTTFREYRAALAGGAPPLHEAPILPSDAVPIQGQRAGVVSRAVAASIDVCLVFIGVLGTVAGLWMLSFIVDPVSGTTAAAQASDRLPDIGWLIAWGYTLNIAYWTAGWALGGRTVGNLIMGLRVVNYRGERVRWLGAFVRAVFCTLFIPGLLWVIVSGTNRSVQDVVLRTSVIHDWVVGVPRLTRTPPAPERP